MSHFKGIVGVITFGLLILTSHSTWSADLEITPYVGQTFAADLSGIDGESQISIDSATNIGLSFAWQDTPNGQGQVLINAVSHDFSNDLNDQDYSLDVIYAHFSGIAQFRQRHYVTTVSIGLGGSYFDADGGEELYPSLTAAMGTRYEFSQNLSLVTEIRGYASIIDENDDLFCKDDICSAQFDDTLWIETSVSVGVAYKF